MIQKEKGNFLYHLTLVFRGDEAKLIKSVLSISPAEKI